MQQKGGINPTPWFVAHETKPRCENSSEILHRIKPDIFLYRNYSQVASTFGV